MIVITSLKLLDTFVLKLLIVMSFRYMAIMNPLKPRMGKKSTLCIAVLIWVGK